MTKWLQRFDTWPKQWVVLLCILLVTLVGLVDYITGYETFFFTFYLLPILLATWRTGGWFGGLVSALSVAAWVSANIADGARYSSYLVPVWNAGIMLAIYWIVVYLLKSLKQIYAELEERVRLRTEALSREMQQRMRLQKEVLETTDREQRRVGRELHDGLCQHLTGTAMAGHLLGQKLTAKSQPESAEASRLVQLIEEAIELTRDLSRQLDPVEMQTAKLTDHFADLAAGVSARFKVACRFDASLDQPLEDPKLATHLFRIAQAAVTHAIKPGQATHINIGLDSCAEEVVLTITDDGMGRLETNSVDSDALLRAMAYRADLIGAALHIDRATAKGTRITCVLPFSGTITHAG
jgi:signal transduction histidine kinase